MLPFKQCIPIRTDFDVCVDLDPPPTNEYRRKLVDKVASYYDDKDADNIRSMFNKFVSELPENFVVDDSDVWKTLPVVPAPMKHDRSSLYRSLAILFLGYQLAGKTRHGYNYWSVIQNAVLEHMKRNPAVFDLVCNRFGETSANAYWEKCFSEKNKIVEEIELRVITHMFNVTIYIFTEGDMENGRYPKILKPHNVYEYKGSGFRFEQPVFGIHLLRYQENYFEPIVAFNRAYHYGENIPPAVTRTRAKIPNTKGKRRNDEKTIEGVSTMKKSKSDTRAIMTTLRELPRIKTEKIPISRVPDLVNEEDKEKLLKIAYQGEVEKYKYTHFPEIRDDSNVFETYQVAQDGNSFFRSIAYLLTGREILHERLREVLHKFMSDERHHKTMDEICHMFGVTFSINNYMQTRKIGELDVEACEVEIHAISVLYNTPICIFGDQPSRNPAMYQPKTEDVCPRVLVIQRTNNNFRPVIRYNKNLKHKEKELIISSLTDDSDSFGSISSQDLLNANMDTQYVSELAYDLMLSDSEEDEIETTNLETSSLVPYSYEPADQLDNNESFTIIVHGASGSQQEKVDYASSVVFKKNEATDSHPSEEDEVELQHDELNEKLIMKETSLVKLTKMINRYFAASPVTREVLQHFQKVTRDASVSELRNCHPTDDRIRTHLAKIIDMRIGLEKFNGFQRSKVSEESGQAALGFACLALPNSLDDTRFAYYHTGGVGGSWKPIAINEDAFKRGNDMYLPGQTIVMGNDLLCVGLGYLFVTDLFGTEKKKILEIPEVRDTHVELLIGRSNRGQVYILDMEHQRCIELTKDYDLRWTNVQTMNKDKFSYLSNHKCDIYTIEMTGHDETVYVYVPKSKTESELFLTDVHVKNQLPLRNEFVVSLGQPGNDFNIKTGEYGLKIVRLSAFDENPSTKYILVSAQRLNNHIEKLRKVKK